MTLDQTARDLVRTILELQDQRAPEYIIVGTVRRVLAAEREKYAVMTESYVRTPGAILYNEWGEEDDLASLAAIIRALP